MYIYIYAHTYVYACVEERYTCIHIYIYRRQVMFGIPTSLAASSSTGVLGSHDLRALPQDFAAEFQSRPERQNCSHEAEFCARACYVCFVKGPKKGSF